MALDIDEVKVARNEAGLFLGWTLATTAGLLLGFLPFLLFVDNLDLLLVRILLPLWAGFLVGHFQWLVLRGYLSHSVDWILNGGAGWALGFAIGLLIIQALRDSPLGILIGYILFGVVVGLLQWPVLRREIPSALPWIIASIIGWALGAYLSQVVLNVFFPGDTLSQTVSTIVVAIVTGLVAGSVTGLALVWISRRPDIQRVS
jgi:hypothetical protein